MMVFADIWKFFNIREMCKIKIKSKITVYANSLCKNVENSLKHIFLAYIAYIAILGNVIIKVVDMLEFFKYA